MDMVIDIMSNKGLYDMGVILGGWVWFVNGLKIFFQFPGLAWVPKMA